MATIEDIRQKYCADKRQTGQVGVFGGKGDKPMIEAIKKIRASVATLTKFAQQRRNQMYKTKLNMF